MKRQIDRRSLLATLGTVTFCTATAGCLGSGDDNGNGDDDPRENGSEDDAGNSTTDGTENGSETGETQEPGDVENAEETLREFFTSISDGGVSPDQLHEYTYEDSLDDLFTLLSDSLSQFSIGGTTISADFEVTSASEQPTRVTLISDAGVDSADVDQLNNPTLLKVQTTIDIDEGDIPDQDSRTIVRNVLTFTAVVFVEAEDGSTLIRHANFG